MSSVRFVERKLGDLDEAYTSDKLTRIISKLTYTEGDRAGGRQPPAELVGKSENPVRYLRNLRAYVGNYRQFLDSIHGPGQDIWTASDDEALEADKELRETKPLTPHPLNQILYGPPGTGKTWHTARIAVEICNGSAPESREELMAAYADLRSGNRIMFTTFHQSMGYEDFVEGLRPTTEDEDGEASNSGGFRLQPRNGIFRQICTLADQSRKRGGKAPRYEFAGRDFYKMSLGKAYTEQHVYDAAIEGGYIVLGWGGNVDWSDPNYRNFEAVLARWRENEPEASGYSGNVTQVWRFRSMKVGDIVVVSYGNHRFRAIGEVAGDYEFCPDGSEWNHRRKVNWLAVLDQPLPIEMIYEGQLSQQSCYRLRTDRVKLSALAQLFAPTGDSHGGAEQYVLIIDEINRANISKVLGELITLIEPDKRLGEPNELTVVLPYSGDEFGVPNNLYVVATMNTADRSIALLDTALRRRFHFLEMLPDYGCLQDTIVDGIPLGDLLASINRRIEWLFDRDHQIGHAVFSNVRSKSDLDQAMSRMVVPLLAEYFYEDWEKVRAVLNDAVGGFVAVEKLPVPTMLRNEGEERSRYTINTSAVPIEAYRRCLVT
jgi:5-methylcytosine-specific restriction protein B